MRFGYNIYTRGLLVVANDPSCGSKALAKFDIIA